MLWQKAKTNNVPFEHKKQPIPEAIVSLLKPIYKRLGSKELLERCVAKFRMNLYMQLFCPKELFLGKLAVDTACAIAVCIFNNGITSLGGVLRTWAFNRPDVVKLFNVQRIAVASRKVAIRLQSTART